MKKLLALVVASLATLATVTQAQVRVGPITHTQEISGQTVSVPVVVDLDFRTIPEGVRLVAKPILDLTDLQAKFGAIVKATPMPRDNCPGFGQHVLPEIEDAGLAPLGSAVRVSLRGNATAWSCQRNPVPETVCGSRRHCVLGVCVDIPECRFREASPVKLRLFNEGFVGSVDIALFSPDKRSVAVGASNTSLQPRGDLGRFLNALAGVFGQNLDKVAGDKIDDLLSTDMFRRSLPGDLMRFNPSIEAISFAAPNGRLQAVAEFHAVVSAQQLTEFLRKALEANR